MVEVVFDDEGRLVHPRGVRLRLPVQFVVRDELDETEEASAERQRTFWEETDAILDATQVKPWPEGDPVVEKYRRKGLIH